MAFEEFLDFFDTRFHRLSFPKMTEKEEEGILLKKLEYIEELIDTLDKPGLNQLKEDLIDLKSSLEKLTFVERKLPEIPVGPGRTSDREFQESDNLFPPLPKKQSTSPVIPGKNVPQGSSWADKVAASCGPRGPKL